MTETQLNEKIKKAVRSVIRSEVSAMIDERIEELSDDIATAVNEVVDIKMTKKIKEILSKKSLKEKIVERSLPDGETINDQWAHLVEGTSSRADMNRLSAGGSGKTGILEDYHMDINGKIPSNIPIPDDSRSSGGTGILGDYRQNMQGPEGVGGGGGNHTLPSVDQLMYQDYPDDLLEG